MVQSDERGPGRNPEMRATDAETSVASRSRTNAEPSALMEAVLERGNLMRAYQRVVRNKGAAGVDAKRRARLAIKPDTSHSWSEVSSRYILHDQKVSSVISHMWTMVNAVVSGQYCYLHCHIVRLRYLGGSQVGGITSRASNQK